MRDDPVLQKVRCRLYDAARERRVLTYTDLAAPLGMIARNVTKVLGQVQSECLNAGFPDLSALVVRKDTGRPGDGFFHPYGLVRAVRRVREDKWAELRSAVHAHDWVAKPLR